MALKGAVENCFLQPCLDWCTITSSLKNTYEIASHWTYIDCQKKEKVSFRKFHSVSKDLTSPVASCADFVIQGNATLWDIKHGTSGRRAICTEYKLPQSADQSLKATFPNVGCYVTLMEADMPVKTIKLVSEDGSKDVKVLSFNPFANCQFASSQWSPDGKSIAFMAELLVDVQEIDSCDAFFRWKDRWGEKFTEVQNPTIRILNVEQESLTQIPPCLLDQFKIVCGQAIWSPEGKGIVFVGYHKAPYRLGLSYCLQRKASLFYWELGSDKLVSISSPTHSAFTPRFSPDGKMLVWLDMFVGGPHLQCQRLVACHWPAFLTRHQIDDFSHTLELVSVVDYPGEEGFPGIYCPAGLPVKCWSQDSKFIFFSSLWGFSSVPLKLDVDAALEACQKERAIIPQTLPNTTEPLIESWSDSRVTPQEITIMQVDERLVLARVSFAQGANQIGLLDYTQPKAQWRFLIGDRLYSEPKICMDNVTTKIFDHKSTTLDQDDQYKVKSFQSMLVYSSPKPKAMIMIIHGGPHSSHVSRWLPKLAVFMQRGFTCLMVNYRGSIGYGDGALHCLLGKVGHYDVSDCVQAAEEANASFETPLPVFLYGGSHGGFLTCHLAARHKEKYRAAAAFNPVTELVTMALTSDIGDWAFVEAGIAQLESSVGCKSTDSIAPRGQLWHMGQIAKETADLTRLATSSPMSYIDESWSMPICFFLGGKDMRVPAYQGEAFFKRVKACTAKSNVKCEAFVYPLDGHALELIPTQIDTLLRSLDFFEATL